MYAWLCEFIMENNVHVPPIKTPISNIKNLDTVLSLVKFFLNEALQ